MEKNCGDVEQISCPMIKDPACKSRESGSDLFTMSNTELPEQTTPHEVIDRTISIGILAIGSDA